MNDVRKPPPQDIPALYAIGLESPELRVLPDQPFASLEEFVELTSEGFFLAAYAGDEPVGFIHAFPWKRFGCVQYLVVAQAHRGKGFGRALAERAILELRGAGASHIYAWAREGSMVNDLVAKMGGTRGGMFCYVFLPHPTEDYR